MAKAGSDLVIASLKGGMNDTGSPHLIADDQVLLAENVEFNSSALGERRLGCESVDMSGLNLSVGDVVAHISIHLPLLAEIVDNELFTVITVPEESAFIGHRVGSTWTIINPEDEIDPTTPFIYQIRAVSIHGKWFVCYRTADSTINRMHVWDGTQFRRTGIAQPGEPTVTGASDDGDRSYRVRFIIMVDGEVILRSEPSEEIMADGPNTTITRPDLVGEGETHWEIEATDGDGNWYIIATLSIDVLTYTDNTVDPGDFSDGTLSEDVGDNENIPAVRFVVADQDRLIFAGHYEDPERDSRISWTPVWGAPGVGNDERIPLDTDNYIDLDWMLGGGITGISEPVNGSFYAFKYNRIYKVQRTGQVDRAYEAFLLATGRGAIQDSLVNGVDEFGRGCVYFLDPQAGPARIGSGGLQFMGGLGDTWDRANTAADMKFCHGLYYPDKQQVHWWIAVDGSNTPSLKIILQTDEVRSQAGGTSGGWCLANGTIAEAYSSCTIPEIMRDEETDAQILTYRPHAGFAWPHHLQRCDIGDTDNGDKYRAIIRTKPYIVAGLLNRWGAMRAALLADSVEDEQVTIDVKLIRDFGLEENLVNTNFLPEKEEELVIKQFDNLVMSQLYALQVEFADPPIIEDDCEPIVYNYAYRPPTGAITFTGYAPTLDLRYILPVGSFTFTGLAPELALGRIPAPASLTLTGLTPEILVGN